MLFLSKEREVAPNNTHRGTRVVTPILAMGQDKDINEDIDKFHCWSYTLNPTYLNVPVFLQSA